ncbi:MAG TPA: aspartate aminotransferase family protein [Bryobacteraceae bacterium]|nr:aspartate aminotransferase family protein [Bryobacteraceae bacterium]
MTRTARKFTTSREMLERARQSLAGGVSSPFRAAFPVPLYFADGRGARLRDVDGNEYIDYALAWGPMILGYGHPALVEAISTAAARPHCLGEEHELEILVAEKIQGSVPCAERVAFTSSGSEAVQLALRLARAHTGRNLILKFEGHYHGWVDGALVSYHSARGEMGPLENPNAVTGSAGQAPNAAENFIVAPWNRPEMLEQVFARHGEQIAAAIMEPVLCNSGCLMPLDGYLAKAQEICRRHGALLIFDEVITGFRMSLAGAQGFYGVTPDLATFGKAVAGGLPLSVVAGRQDIMEQMFGGGVAFGGTFNGNPVSLAAAHATLGELSRDGGALLAQTNERGRRLMAGLHAAAARRGVALTVTGFGAAMSLHFTSRQELIDYRDTLDDDREMLQRVLRRALEEGLHLLPDGRLYVSAAHTDVDIEETIGAFERALGE